VRTHFVPIIFLTVTDLRQFRLRALAAGADAVFSPTVDSQERRTRLWALLRTRALYRRMDRKQRSQGTEISERRRWLSYLLHDLQGSVAALRANVDYLSRFAPAKTDPRRRDFDEAVEDAGTVFDQLMHSVRTVLDFDRFEAGSLSLATKSIRMGELVRDVVAELGRNPALMGEIDFTRPAEETPLSLDPELIRGVLINLIMYCVRRGNGKTSVRVSSDDGRVSVWIACRGAGATSAEKQEMFEPYSQLEEKPVGYGLGLALARAVVALHGGRIRLEEVPAGGISFVFQLGGGKGRGQAAGPGPGGAG